MLRCGAALKVIGGILEGFYAEQPKHTYTHMYTKNIFFGRNSLPCWSSDMIS